MAIQCVSNLIPRGIARNVEHDKRDRPVVLNESGMKPKVKLALVITSRDRFLWVGRSGIV